MYGSASYGGRTVTRSPTLNDSFLGEPACGIVASLVHLSPTKCRTLSRSRKVTGRSLIAAGLANQSGITGEPDGVGRSGRPTVRTDSTRVDLDRCGDQPRVARWRVRDPPETLGGNSVENDSV